jgi:branched-chain amino acid transport system permease protein
MDFFIERLVDGLSLGSICGLLALANSLCWTANRSLILAASASYVAGGAVSLAAIRAAGTLGAELAPFALPIGILAGITTAAALDLTIRSAITRTTGNSPVPMLVSSAGLLLIAFAALQFSNQLPVAGGAPNPAPRLTFAVRGFFDLTIPAVPLVIVIGSAALVLAVWWLCDVTHFGKARRLAAQDAQMAELFGINVGRVKFISILICGGLASCAGAMNVIAGRAMDANSVSLTAAIAFVAAALAGLRSTPRAALAGMVAGAGVAFWSDYFSPDYSGLSVFAALLFLLIFAPPKPAIRGTSEQF